MFANNKNFVFVKQIKIADDKQRQFPLSVPFPYLKSMDGTSIIPLKMASILELKKE